ncbi:class I SAM-dependent methyltransferase [Nocardioides marmoriginsengisoli]|uniref:Class I SAM-dependent methyltransferase n=2 Tax=Nocardioides marmoriginsengisoli TaxID=661483 RepID=A0A3N0CRI4_9ACTN|nr:class I SAM-dependent methyltransferase [Nocardioides marmoriginsengisoli]
MSVSSAAPMTLKQRVARVAPAGLVDFLDRFAFGFRRTRIRFTHWFFGLFGQNVVAKKDYYSTLPVLSEIKATRARWDKPSNLAGLDIEFAALEKNLGALADRWETEFQQVAPDHAANSAKGFGPGYPAFDARTLYYKLREHKPARYLEVGSGLSTYYASLAAGKNAEDGSPLSITCIEPYPYDALRTIDGFELIEGFVQDIPVERFEELESGDVLFIDSSHALKIDSDVAYLFLEVLPRIKPGVFVHIHDVHFPFNGPFPADTWIFGERPPVYWNEAMVVQTFLAFNNAFEIQLSTPMVRHFDEQFLIDRFPDYTELAKDVNPPSSLWLQRVS